MKIAIVVDMQNDFITGSLANKAAQAIIEPMVNFLSKEKNTCVIFTRDTHDLRYLTTTEGKNLPVEHCLKETTGWAIRDELFNAVRNNKNITAWGVLDKPTFGYIDWQKFIDTFMITNYGTDCMTVDEIVLVGTCTDICVISNALILRAVYPDAKIKVIANLCAGLTQEKHEAALEVMRSCQIEVI